MNREAPWSQTIPLFPFTHMLRVPSLTPAHPLTLRILFVPVSSAQLIAVLLSVEKNNVARSFFFFFFSHKCNLCWARRKIIIYGDCPVPCAVVSAEWDSKQGTAYVCNTEGEGGGRELTVSVENDGDLLRSSRTWNLLSVSKNIVFQKWALTYLPCQVEGKQKRKKKNSAQLPGVRAQIE